MEFSNHESDNQKVDRSLNQKRNGHQITEQMIPGKKMIMGPSIQKGDFIGCRSEVKPVEEQQIKRQGQKVKQSEERKPVFL